MRTVAWARYRADGSLTWVSKTHIVRPSSESLLDREKAGHVLGGLIRPRALCGIEIPIGASGTVGNGTCERCEVRREAFGFGV